jgi:hypothetical protein
MTYDAPVSQQFVCEGESCEDFDPQQVNPTYDWLGPDKAWCLVTDIDFDSTLVGGSATLIEEILV